MSVIPAPEPARSDQGERFSALRFFSHHLPYLTFMIVLSWMINFPELQLLPNPVQSGKLNQFQEKPNENI